MSLLEDVFLQDEAGEAQELERIIEGDEYDERPRGDYPDSNEDSEKEDEAEEEKRRVDPSSTKTKHVVKHPRFILNPARLTGPRGIQVLPEHFKDFKFKGKGHEKEDLDLVLKKLEHWAYRLYPKFKFEDSLKKIETLGKKRPVMVHLHKIRSDQLLTEETVVQKDSSDEEPPAQEEDEFDKLLAQQIELARSTPAPGSVKKPAINTPVDKISPFIMPKATSSPSISDEQKERMIRNRKLAEERRLARIKAATLGQNDNTETTVDLTNINGNLNEDTASTIDLTNINGNINAPTVIIDDVITMINDKKHKKNRSHVIDSSDEDDNDASTVNKAATIEIHRNTDADVIDITNGYQSKNKSIVISETVDIDGIEDERIESSRKRPKHNRSNVIDSSSDDDCGINTVNEAITVDVHNTMYSIDSDDSNRLEIDETGDQDDNDIGIIYSNVDNVKPIEKDIAETDDSHDKNKDSELAEDINDTDKKVDSDIDLPIATSDVENEIQMTESVEHHEENEKSEEAKEVISEKEEISTDLKETVDSCELIVGNQDTGMTGDDINKTKSAEKENSTSKETEVGLDDLIDVDFNDDF